MRRSGLDLVRHFGGEGSTIAATAC
jgi:hypothetical protein